MQSIITDCICTCVFFDIAVGVYLYRRSWCYSIRLVFPLLLLKAQLLDLFGCMLHQTEVGLHRNIVTCAEVRDCHCKHQFSKVSTRSIVFKSPRPQWLQMLGTTELSHMEIQS